MSSQISGDLQMGILKDSLEEPVKSKALLRAARPTKIFASGTSKVITLPPETATFLGRHPYAVIYHLQDRVFLELIVPELVNMKIDKDETKAEIEARKMMMDDAAVEVCSEAVS
jgi:hypothetical protein